MARLPWLSDVTPIASRDAPLVSIIFAARDEAEKLPAAIQTLLAQDYPRFEVIAVNDRSTDQTPAILHECERASRNLIVTDISSLPQGWLGKPHALVEGYEKSRGDWLVFTDADVHFAPDVLSHAVALAAEREWDHLTLSLPSKCADSGKPRRFLILVSDLFSATSPGWPRIRARRAMWEWERSSWCGARLTKKAAATPACAWM